jgi:prophage DNA circulation protein
MPATSFSATDFAALQAENDALRGQVSGFSNEVKSLSALVEKLTFQLAMLRRMQFGQKSEASARRRRKRPAASPRPRRASPCRQICRWKRW